MPVGFAALLLDPERPADCLEFVLRLDADARDLEPELALFGFDPELPRAFDAEELDALELVLFALDAALLVLDAPLLVDAALLLDFAEVEPFGLEAAEAFGLEAVALLGFEAVRRAFEVAALFWRAADAPFGLAADELFALLADPLAEEPFDELRPCCPLRDDVDLLSAI
jgi:hypothetical protein